MRHIALLFAAATLAFACGTPAQVTPDSGPAQSQGDGGITLAQSTIQVNLTATQLSLSLGPLPVPAQSQIVYCANVTLPNEATLPITSFTSTQSKGGHHVIVFANKVDTAESPAVVCSQTIDPRTKTYIYISQKEQDQQGFPPGVGLLVTGRTSVMLQVHYINTSSAPIQVSTVVNMNIGAPGQVTIPAAPLLFYRGEFSVPPGASHVEASCNVGQGFDVAMFAGHMHSHGTNFFLHMTQGLPDGGAPPFDAGNEQDLYDTTSWDSPPEQNYPNGFTVPDGGTFHWGCDYQNDGTATIDEPDEMCAVLGNLYPAPHGGLICYALKSGHCYCGYLGNAP